MLTRSGGAPTRALLLATALLALVGGVLLVLGLTGPARTPADALAPVATGSTVQAGDDGFSLWSTDAGAFETAVCTAEGTLLLRPSAAYSIAVAGTTYHEVARSPRALPAGAYAIECTPEQALYAGPHAERTAVSVVRGPVGVVAGAVPLGLAIVLGVTALLAHRRQQRLEAWRVPAHRLDPRLPHPDERQDGGQEAQRTSVGLTRAELRRRGRRRDRR